MLDQPNERIDEIWKEAREELGKPKESGCGTKFGAWLILMLLLLLCAAMVGANERALFACAGIGLILGVFTLLDGSGPRTDGGIHDPSFFMPFIMRMVGEILKEEWGEYTFEQSFRSVVITFPEQLQSTDQQGGRACTLEYHRIYDTGEEAEDRGCFFLFWAYPPTKSLKAQSDGRSSPYADLSRRMLAFDQCRPHETDGVDGWRLCFYEIDYRSQKQNVLEVFGQEEWFAYAHDLALKAMNTTRRIRFTIRLFESSHPGVKDAGTWNGADC